MTSDPKMPNLSDESLFDLLEHPEHWPEDPETQAQLAELLELHLAMRAHADDLDAALHPKGTHTWWRSNLLAAAASVALVTVPTGYAVYHSHQQTVQRRSLDHIQAVAQRRGQDRILVAFLRQSGELLRTFERNPPVCGDNRNQEDRSAERQLALALKTRSQVLMGQEAPAEAKVVLGNLHDWLLEVSLEDGCMTPERVAELRQLARTTNLPDEIDRLSRTLAGGTP